MTVEDYARKRAALLEDLDGMRVEKDAERAVGTLIFDRPPMNVISYKGRFQIRALLEAMDEDPDIRVIVIRGANGLYSSGGDIPGFSEGRPGRHVGSCRSMSRHRSAAANR